MEVASDLPKTVTSLKELRLEEVKADHGQEADDLRRSIQPSPFMQETQQHHTVHLQRPPSDRSRVPSPLSPTSSSNPSPILPVTPTFGAFDHQGAVPLSLDARTFGSETDQIELESVDRSVGGTRTSLERRRSPLHDSTIDSTREIVGRGRKGLIALLSRLEERRHKAQDGPLEVHDVSVQLWTEWIDKFDERLRYAYSASEEVLEVGEMPGPLDDLLLTPISNTLSVLARSDLAHRALHTNLTVHLPTSNRSPCVPEKATPDLLTFQRHDDIPRALIFGESFASESLHAGLTHLARYTRGLLHKKKSTGPPLALIGLDQHEIDIPSLSLPAKRLFTLTDAFVEILKPSDTADSLVEDLCEEVDRSSDAVLTLFTVLERLRNDCRLKPCYNILGDIELRVFVITPKAFQSLEQLANRVRTRDEASNWLAENAELALLFDPASKRFVLEHATMDARVADAAEIVADGDWFVKWDEVRQNLYLHPRLAYGDQVAITTPIPLGGIAYDDVVQDALHARASDFADNIARAVGILDTGPPDQDYQPSPKSPSPDTSDRPTKRSRLSPV